MTCYANNSNDTSPTSCPSHDCGNGVPIRYPFWRRSITTTTTTTACGYPDFGLECSNDGQPIFKLPTDTYYVKDINYETNSITLVDMDIIVVTVLKNDHEIQSGGLITGFGAAMNNGFVLDWMKAGECAECEGSGGFCGYNQTNKHSMCICKDDSIVVKSCKKGMCTKISAS
ncbi:hypothetical protein TanjilG_22283 [Lupinus angustifolius]|uniref:non-specific serine/threonine protein kinase n=1 Tax=Lupinus angustifolius TaxID=3871 RepID=A0A1J7HAZ5_LUPAN|nr:hypothetical protein TanjilG_22283 [Lupinus angustifolius]